MLSLEEYEKRIGYRFKNKDLLETALTHSSFANEHKCKSYERLEFLGDSVLGFVTAEYLFENFPQLPEGQLTKTRASLGVRAQPVRVLQKPARGGFPAPEPRGTPLRRPGAAQHPGGCVRVHHRCHLPGQRQPGGSQEVHPAVYHPRGQAQSVKPFKDYKTTLQEIIQQNPEERLEYVVTGESGPDHDKHFTVEVHLNSNVIGKGGGRSKKEAEQQAAREALELMGY